MSLLFIISILFALASFSFALYFLIVGIVYRNSRKIVSGLACLGLTAIALFLPFYVVTGMLSESFRN